MSTERSRSIGRIGVVRVVFDRPVDLSRVDVTFLLGASGTLVDPQSNPVTMDLTEPARFTVASERAGETVYTIEAEIDMGFVVPDGWTEVKDYELPYYMRLYRADDLAGAEAYALVADTNAVFTVTGGGVMQQATMPEYYERNSSSVALINGGTGTTCWLSTECSFREKPTRRMPRRERRPEIPV